MDCAIDPDGGNVAGGFHNVGPLTIDGTILHENSDYDSAGGISSTGEMLVSSSIISANSSHLEEAAPEGK
jgi:hypothetical protein